ncbi:MAG: hypothetical protein KAT05_08595 [Spirochaetes bacterium]|nr:hypothetical protein [Spirochaetota bacterium]
MSVELYSNLTWALILNSELKSKLFEKYKHKPRYLIELDNLILDLINSKCENIQEKMKDVNDLNKFNSMISELKIARFLVQSGTKVELLSDDYFDGKSPDILYKYDDLESYIEVTRLGEVESINSLFDSIRALLKNFPYRIDIELKSELSLPRLTGKERTVQDNLLESSLEKLESVLESDNFTEFPVKIETDTIIFNVYPTSKKGYLGIITTEVIEVPDNLMDYVGSKILIKKANKRDDFKGEHRGYFYIIAFDCEESSIDELDMDGLLYGDIGGPILNAFKYPEEVYEKWKQKEWNSIIDRVRINPTWDKIEQAKEKGWESFLVDKYLIPNNYSNRNGNGLFLSEPDLNNVSGILFRTKWNKHFFYPNPFCHSEINCPDIQQIFDF